MRYLLLSLAITLAACGDTTNYYEQPVEEPVPESKPAPTTPPPPPPPPAPVKPPKDDKDD